MLEKGYLYEGIWSCCDFLQVLGLVLLGACVGPASLARRRVCGGGVAGSPESRVDSYPEPETALVVVNMGRKISLRTALTHVGMSGRQIDLNCL